MSEYKLPVNESLLRDSVLGRESVISRPIAMRLFLRADFENKEKVYKTVLEDPEEAPGFKYLAAVHLGRLNTTSAKAILKDISEKEEDPEVLGGVVKSLGFIGGRETFNNLKRITETAFDDQLKRKSRFAATLVAYRYGIKEFDLKTPDNLIKIGDIQSMKIAVKAATRTEKKYCLDSLKDVPVGFTYDKKGPVQLDCVGNKLIILRNSSFLDADKVGKLMERKGVFGLIATKSPEDNTYSPAFYIFTTPDPGGGHVNIVTTRTTGELVSAGKARPDRRNRSKAVFETNGVDDYGVNPVFMSGEINNGEMIIKSARSGLTVPKKRNPRALVVER